MHGEWRMEENNLGTEDILWNLLDLYQGLDDQRIQTDIAWCQSESVSLKTAYAGKIASLQDTDLLDLVGRLEKLETLLGKLSTYAFLNFTTQTKKPQAGAFLQKIKETHSAIAKETVFFELEWNKVPDELAEKLLHSEKLSHYCHHLLTLRKYAKHLLSEQEETLLLEKAPVGRSSWTNLFEKIMGHMKFGKDERSEEEVLAELYHPGRETRKQAAIDLTEGLKSHLHILTHIFNTLLAEKMIDDRLRKYPAWVRSMNLYNDLADETVSVLIDAVVSRYDIPQRYYRLKRSLLEYPELYDYDRYAPLPHLPTEQIPWQQCKEMVLASFADFSPVMAEIADQFFTKKWIHAPIVDGKRGGAFAHPCVPEVHPYVLVNYTGNIRDVSTVAHELGHGIHQHLAAKQGYYNSGTTLVLAETASVFAELLLFKSQLGLISSKEQRRAFACQKLESIFATVFRQISMNRFEELVHVERREQGELSSEQLTKHWLNTQKAMFGESLTLTPDYGCWWSYIPHFLNSPGYVYSYAFGELLVLALYKIYQEEGKSFVPKYIEMLSAGGSKSPYDLVKPFGVDLDDPSFWHGGLSIIDSMLATVE